MLVESALDNLRRVLKILAQVVFGHIQQLNLHVLAKIGFIHQGLHAPPQAFNGLEVRVVHHRIQLAANLVVQLRDVVVDEVAVELLHF